MPVKSGTEVSAAYRAWEAEQAQQMGVYTRLPIVALTANVMQEHAAECESSGMGAHLPRIKPCFSLSPVADAEDIFGSSPDLFLSKPLRDAAIPALRAHAAAHSEQRAVELTARSATREATAAAAAAAAGAAASHAIMGPPVVHAQLQLGEKRT